MAIIFVKTQEYTKVDLFVEGGWEIEGNIPTSDSFSYGFLDRTAVSIVGVCFRPFCICSEYFWE